MMKLMIALVLFTIFAVAYTEEIEEDNNYKKNYYYVTKCKTIGYKTKCKNIYQCLPKYFYKTICNYYPKCKFVKTGYKQ